jgi:hypothetical protein
MKKLLFVAALLAVLVTGVFAQAEFGSSTSPDTVYLTMKVKMIGLSFTVDGILEGSHNSSSLGAATFTAATDSINATFAPGYHMHPCDTAELFYTIENTGGITADFEFAAVNGDPAAAPNKWNYDATGFGTCGGENTYTIGYYALEGAGFLTSELPTTVTDVNPWTQVAGVFADLGTSTAPIVDINLVAEDPENIGDGTTYDDGELDCMDFMWFMRAPSSATESTLDHLIVARLLGKVDAD